MVTEAIAPFTTVMGQPQLSLYKMEKKTNLLIDYITMLDEWNEKINLVSYKTLEELLINHIIDSLSIMELFYFHNKLIGDLGSGAGLPGIVLSITQPLNKYILIEPNKKYYRFLKKVILNLNLTNIKLINKKVENIENVEFCNIIVSRAVEKIEWFINMSQLKNIDIIVFYKGFGVFHELQNLKLKKFKILLIKKIKILEKYNKNHYIIALKRRK